MRLFSSFICYRTGNDSGCMQGAEVWVKNPLFGLRWGCYEWHVIWHFTLARVCSQLLHNCFVWKRLCNNLSTRIGFAALSMWFLSLQKNWGGWTLEASILETTKLFTFCLLFTALYIPATWWQYFLRFGSIWILFQGLLNGVYMLFWWS